MGLMVLADVGMKERIRPVYWEKHRIAFAEFDGGDKRLRKGGIQI